MILYCPPPVVAAKDVSEGVLMGVRLLLCGTGGGGLPWEGPVGGVEPIGEPE